MQNKVFFPIKVVVFIFIFICICIVFICDTVVRSENLHLDSRMAEWSKVMRLGCILPWKRGLKSHFCQCFWGGKGLDWEPENAGTFSGLGFGQDT